MHRRKKKRGSHGVHGAISVETATAHLDSVRFELQGLDRTHAVTKAMRAGHRQRSANLRPLRWKML